MTHEVLERMVRNCQEDGTNLAIDTKGNQYCRLITPEERHKYVDCLYLGNTQEYNIKRRKTLFSIIEYRCACKK